MDMQLIITVITGVLAISLLPRKTLNATAHAIMYAIYVTVHAPCYRLREVLYGNGDDDIEYFRDDLR
jgi:hypothetical protein